MSKDVVQLTEFPHSWSIRTIGSPEQKHWTSKTFVAAPGWVLVERDGVVYHERREEIRP